MLFGKGTTDGADLTLSTDIDTARAVFVSGDQQAGMQAFMAGKVRVQGDMTKLMMQGGGGAQPGSSPPRCKRSPPSGYSPRWRGSGYFALAGGASLAASVTSSATVQRSSLSIVSAAFHDCAR